jgi:hypothetical protein
MPVVAALLIEVHPAKQKSASASTAYFTSANFVPILSPNQFRSRSSSSEPAKQVEIKDTWFRVIRDYKAKVRSQLERREGQKFICQEMK